MADLERNGAGSDKLADIARGSDDDSDNDESSDEETVVVMFRPKK